MSNVFEGENMSTRYVSTKSPLTARINKYGVCASACIATLLLGGVDHARASVFVNERSDLAQIVESLELGTPLRVRDGRGAEFDGRLTQRACRVHCRFKTKMIELNASVTWK